MTVWKWTFLVILVIGLIALLGSCEANNSADDESPVEPYRVIMEADDGGADTYDCAYERDLDAYYCERLTPTSGRLCARECEGEGDYDCRRDCEREIGWRKMHGIKAR